MKGIVLVVESLNIINLYAIYDPVTGPEQPIYVVLCIQYETKNGDKDLNRNNQVPHLTQDTKWDSNNLTIYTTNESQEVSPFPAGDRKAPMSRRESTEITQMIHQRSTALERSDSVKVFYYFDIIQVLYRLTLNSHKSLLSRYTAGYM